MIIGLTGMNAAGKTEAAKFLIEKGFSYHSLSDELREVCSEEGIEPIRENLIALGNRLREDYGANYLASRINKKIKQDSNYVIDSIRNPEEIKELQKNKDFILIGIDAPIKLRFERSKKRARTGDAETLEQFSLHEEKENSDNKSGQQLKVCLGMAEKIIYNDASLQEFHNKIEEIIK